MNYTKSGEGLAIGSFLIFSILVGIIFAGEMVGNGNYLFTYVFFVIFLLTIFGIHFIHQEKREIFSSSIHGRWPWRFVYVVCYINLILCLIVLFESKLFLGFFDGIKKWLTSTLDNTNLAKGKTGTREISAQLTIILTVLASIVGVVGRYLYSTVKDMEGKVINCDEKIGETKILFEKMNLHIAIRTFFDENDAYNTPNERYILNALKSTMLLQEKFLRDKANLQELKLALENKYMTIDAFWQGGNLAEEAKAILHNHYLPYLDDLISRFRAHHNASSPHGDECLEQLNKFWRLFSR